MTYISDVCSVINQQFNKLGPLFDNREEKKTVQFLCLKLTSCLSYDSNEVMEDYMAVQLQLKLKERRFHFMKDRLLVAMCTH